MALDISLAVMTGYRWTEEPGYRRGGVLFIASEGAGSMPMRLAAIIKHNLIPTLAEVNANIDYRLGMGDTKEVSPINTQRLPFRWAGECPTLLDRNSDAMAVLIATAKAADKHFREKHGLPLALVIIDTASASAGWDNEDSNAEVDKVWRLLRKVNDATNALVLVVDHFGKTATSGARGGSAKDIQNNNCYELDSLRGLMV